MDSLKPAEFASLLLLSFLIEVNRFGSDRGDKSVSLVYICINGVDPNLLLKLFHFLAHREFIMLAWHDSSEFGILNYFGRRLFNHLVSVGLAS